MSLPEPYYTDHDAQIYHGDAAETLRVFPAGIAHTCVTSPPYFGLRDYGNDGQIGLEETTDEYIDRLVAVFARVRRVLRDDGTMWLNLGDSYGAGKQMLGIPWRVALALQDDGWYLRSDIIWHKPNPMPESVTDRPTKAHEYVFLLAKSQRYYYDAEAIEERANNEARPAGQYHKHPDSGRREGQTPGSTNLGAAVEFRNKRTVWTVAGSAYAGAHFAVFPPALIEPCILAGSPEGGVVLDPFMGSGTTAHTARRLGRKSIGTELNADYIELAAKRLQQQSLLADGAA